MPSPAETFYRVASPPNVPRTCLNRILCGDARHRLPRLPGECIALAITSPPYWNVVGYGYNGQIGHSSYDDYLHDLMFGSYPYPPNLYEDNTIEFIQVFAKEGKPLPLSREAKRPSRIPQAAWRNLTMQVWNLYPADVRRQSGHPCPFPVALPLRLVRMYTFQQAPDCGFAGDIVLDMFCGTGSVCLAAQASGRPFIGIDQSPEFCRIARQRLAQESVDPDDIFLEPSKVKKASARVASFVSPSGYQEKFL